MLPVYVGDLINLDWLYLSQTKVSTLSDLFGAPKVLRVLNLLQRKVSMLPESIGALTILKELDLLQTELSILPYSVSDLINLDW